jgi:hypothetical protein
VRLYQKFFFVVAAVTFTFAATAIGQTEGEQKAEKKSEKPGRNDKSAFTMTAEALAESTIFVYGFPSGRAILDQIRKSSTERGRMNITQPDGKIERVNYQRYAIRGETHAADKVRIDQEYPTARFALIYDGTKTFGVFNNAVFVPAPEAIRSMESGIFRGLDTLLRYKESGSTLLLGQREKIMGVDYQVLDITDDQGRTTRFFISAKSYRVMMLTYTDGGVEYRRRFYDYNYAQGTLVPYRSVLWAGDSIVEEVELGTVTYGQKVDEGLFKAD